MKWDDIKDSIPGDELAEVLEPILKWFRFPDPDNHHKDNIWHDFHIFDGHWVEIQNRVEWYESPKVPQIYKDHVYIIKKAMELGRPEETFYYQNVDSNEFSSEIEKDGNDLPSGAGGAEWKLEIELEAKTPPSGENDFAWVEYFVKTSIRYKMPQGITFLPRIVARPLNRFFKWAFLQYLGEEMIDYDGEYAREKTNEYFQHLRKYHGEEPTQTKTRQAEFKPMPEEGVFFQ